MAPVNGYIAVRSRGVLQAPLKLAQKVHGFGVLPGVGFFGFGHGFRGVSDSFIVPQVPGAVNIRFSEAVSPGQQISPIVHSHARPFRLRPLGVPFGMDTVETLRELGDPDLVMGVEPVDDLFDGGEGHGSEPVGGSGPLTP